MAGEPGVYTRLSAYGPWIKSMASDVAVAEPAASIHEAPTEATGFKALEEQLARRRAASPSISATT
ncbi:MAG: hypothetical protein WDN06_06885 [Asticcacaulis sp.]